MVSLVFGEFNREELQKVELADFLAHGSWSKVEKVELAKILASRSIFQRLHLSGWNSPNFALFYILNFGEFTASKKVINKFTFQSFSNILGHY